MAKGKHTVKFIAKKPTETQVKFKTRDGDTVKFNATKDMPQPVKFQARNK